MINYIWGTLQQQLSKKVSYNLWKNRFLVYFIILKSWQNQIMQKYLLLRVSFRCWQFHVRKIIKISSGLEFRSSILRKTAKLLKWTFSKNDSEFSNSSPRTLAHGTLSKVISNDSYRLRPSFSDSCSCKYPIPSGFY